MTLQLLSLAIFLVLITSMLMVVGCGQPVGNDTPSPDGSPIATTVPPVVISPTASPTATLSWSELRQKVAAGSEIAEALISLIPQNNVWLTTITPQNGDEVRILSRNEQDKILRIATAFEPVTEALSNPEVTRVDPRDYFWKSYVNADTVTVSNAYLEEQGINQKLIEYMGDQNYPGVFLIFHTQYDFYTYAVMNVVVDLEQEKVVYIEGFVTAAQVPPDDLSGVDPASFTLDYLLYGLSNLLNPLNPDYDPAGKYGPEGTRFGPPWDRGPGPTFAPTAS